MKLATILRRIEDGTNSHNRTSLSLKNTNDRVPRIADEVLLMS